MSRARWLWPPLAALVIAVLLPLAVFLFSVMLAGYRLEVVESGSMQPTFPVASMLVVQPVDPADVKVGMPLSFIAPDGEGMITHRVIAVVERKDGLSFRTQGDANHTPDATLVPARAVRGRVRWSVPTLGPTLTWLAWPRGFIVLVAIPSLVLLVDEIRARRVRVPTEAVAGP